MTAAWTAWVRFWARREDATPLALFRIALGAAVAVSLAGDAWSGVAALVWGDAGDTPLGFRAVASDWRWELVGGGNWNSVRAGLGLTIACALLLALGIVPRVAAFATLQGYLALTELNGIASAGFDRVATNALWLLVFARSGTTLSVPCRWRTGRWRSGEAVPAWPRYLAVIQLSLIYTSSGLHKLSPEWFPWSGATALHNMLLTPYWARWDYAGFLGELAPLTALGTTLTWLWECSFWLLPVTMFAGTPLHRPIRTIWVAAGVAFHLGIAALTNVGPFSAFCLALYPCLFGGATAAGRRATLPSP